MNDQKTTWLQRCFQSAKSIYLTPEALLHFFLDYLVQWFRKLNRTGGITPLCLRIQEPEASKVRNF